MLIIPEYAKNCVRPLITEKRYGYYDVIVINDLVRLRNHKNEAKLAKLTMIFTFFVSSSLGREFRML